MKRLYYREVAVRDLPHRYEEPLKALTIPGFLMKGMFEECLNEGAGRVILAFANTRLVGWCLLTPFYASAGQYLAAFYVHPDYRKCGIGRELSVRARDRKEPIIFRANDRNRGFFQSVGLLAPELSTAGA